MINRPEMKARAKASMKNAKNIYLVTLVLLVINFAISALSLKLNYPGLTLSEIFNAVYGNGDAEALYYSMMNSSGIASLFDIILNIMLSIVTIGFSLCCISISRSESINVGMLFDPFAYFLKCIWLNILIGIKVFLWSLLLVVPGIIAAYRYRFAIYCFIDDPDLTASECIARSCELTNGHKGELFVLDLSFIGWSLLTVIPFVSVFVMPYMETTNAHFYNEISGYTPEVSEDTSTPGGYDNYRDPWEQ